MSKKLAIINKQGRIVIPKTIRKKLQYELGEELILKVVGDELRIVSLKQALRNTHTLLKENNISGTQFIEALFQEN
jgi:AbrB family looped-hinge helix DNA binding protein